MATRLERPMPQLPTSTVRRLDALVNRDSFNDDAEYHALTTFFKNWLQQAQMAMEDEGISAAVIERVLNRMVFGHPVGADHWKKRYEELALLQQHSARLPAGRKLD